MRWLNRTKATLSTKFSIQGVTTKRLETGGTSADYKDVGLNLRTSQGTMMSSAVSASSEAEIGCVKNT